MAGSTIKTRIQLKYDTEANWNKSVLVQDGGEKETGTSFIPLKGEVIIYSIDDSHPFSRLKVGDGKTNVVNLPFVPYGGGDSSYTIYSGTMESYREDPTFIPNKGDIIIYYDKETIIEDGQTITIPGIKIGDGLAYNLDLPFLGDDTARRLIDHINDEVRHITAAERQFWNNKLNLIETVTNGNLIFNRM